MKTSQIRNMTVEEVEQHLQDAREELWRLRFRAATEDLQNALLLRTRRRDIARMITILNEHKKGLRKLAQAEAVATPTDEGAES